MKKLGPDHLDVARFYNNLGALYREMGDLELAKEYLERALAIRLKKLGPARWLIHIINSVDKTKLSGVILAWAVYTATWETCSRQSSIMNVH